MTFDVFGLRPPCRILHPHLKAPWPLSRHGLKTLKAIAELEVEIVDGQEALGRLGVFELEQPL